MTMTDPIADFITTLRNAVAVRKETVTVPHSKLRLAIANLLEAEGYLRDVKVMAPDAKSKFQQIAMVMKYAPNGMPIIQGVKRVSHPGQRIYSASGRLHKVLSGVGTSVISTSQGLMTDQQARDKGLGGEVLFKIW